MTQEVLALESGVDRSFLGGIERGERNITFSTMVRLARAFELSASELLQAAEAEQELSENRRDTPSDPGPSGGPAFHR